MIPKSKMVMSNFSDLITSVVKYNELTTQRSKSIFFNNNTKKKYNKFERTKKKEKNIQNIKQENPIYKQIQDEKKKII